MKHFGSTSGLTALVEDQAAPANGMVAYVTSSYNSGYQNGDIKGAFLADTDDTDLVGSGELVTNGTFDTDISGWDNAAPTFTTASFDAGTIEIVASVGIARVNQGPISTTVGQVYHFTVTCTQKPTAASSFVHLGTVAGGTNYVSNLTKTQNAGEVATYTFRATSTELYVQLGAVYGTTVNFDNISVQLADADRSVNNNGLIVNGTVTRTPVATGAELVAYSGFNASNYLEGTEASYVDTLYALGWEQTGGVWEFNHGAVSTAPIDGLTITGTTLKIAGTKPKALIRLTATTPSAEQLAKIEADEGALFQENAQATLYGASDAVTALAHDPDTGLLHVGTSAGRSIFEGLRRVGNTTTSVSTAISASGGLVVEK